MTAPVSDTAAPGSRTLPGSSDMTGIVASVQGTAFFAHPDCAAHEMGDGHPECPERLHAISDQMLASGLDALVHHFDAPLADPADLRRVHPQAYLDLLRSKSPQEDYAWLDPDTRMNPATLRAAYRAAGAAVAATDAVIAGQARNAFCSIRPPGHHATRNTAMGFCFFNNVAVAARRALDVHGLKRVAIIDFDVHHGNGTEDIFAGDDAVLMVSIFQHPFYPYSGAGESAANMVNVPLPAGADGTRLRAAVEAQWLPALERFAPEMLFISAGFDAHREDDMGQLRLVESDYAWVTERMVEVAERHAGGRIVSCLEGGYALSALGRSVVAHLKALAGI